jgi:PKD repeat protein
MRISRLPSFVPLGLVAAILLLTISAPATVAAAAPPNARFDVALSGVVATFTDTSDGEPTAWAWDFGDGGTSVDQNPSHRYAPGRYTAKLTVSNDLGTDHTSRRITVTEPAPDRTFSQNLYSSLVRYQNPDMTSCVAASTLIMLNEVATQGRQGSGFSWTTSTTLTRQRSIIHWARAHDTLEPGPGGTDPNGWRNALNQYGWGDYQDPGTMTYAVFASTSYGATVKTAIMAMARYHRPVGILAWAGGHAQVLNGYVVYGQDPAVSSDFTVNYVYITDPLKRDALRNAKISYAKLIHGPLKYRLRKYRQTDSPLDDPYTPGFLAADDGWYGRYVIVLPVR